MIDEIEKKRRFLMTIGENSITRTMTRKVDTYEYDDLAFCIKTEQVPANEIAELFTDKDFYAFYKKNYLDK